MKERDLCQWLIGNNILENELLAGDDIIAVVIQGEMAREENKSIQKLRVKMITEE